ncbi:hypothetical protein KXD40_002952 [Peronospora effusa]|uniref:Uncharacterized protein n=1 Tax=Peronospora effusa TaxID=542832 RepID=A0A3M6VR94_9STRA|nr:hypothetical protein DD238_003125 [Peronospora effusa]RQM14754.1 hypothetical protein DD237_002178 [Peronospora effusa]UIZ29631.1 hypothetical protein KXD40_002952 [Peronospora effusa]
MPKSKKPQVRHVEKEKCPGMMMENELKKSNDYCSIICRLDTYPCLKEETRACDRMDPNGGVSSRNLHTIYNW